MLLAAAICVAFLALASVARGDVIVVANHTPRVVKFAVAVGNAKAVTRQIDAGDLTVITCKPGEPVRAAFMQHGEKQRFALTNNTAYFFHSLPDSDAIDLHEIEMLHRPAESATPTVPAPTGAQPPPVAAVAAGATPDETSAPQPPPAPKLAKVKVKILVDDDEHAVRELWETRLRKRVAAASKILELYAGISLEVVASDTWITDNEVTDFVQSLAEFERQVSAAPADVAIGFSSQYQLVKGRTHLGGTRGALTPHILIREWSRQISEPERLEVLVHELGHRFGAVHSPEPNSVMRPLLGDRKSVAKGFRIMFDPLNTLAIRLLGEELRDRHIHRLEQVSPATRQNLISVYCTLAKAFPADPAAGQYLVRLGEPPPAVARPERKGGSATLVESARVVRDAVVEYGDRNRHLPLAAAAGKEPRLVGDKLTEKYVRVAAIAALTLPEEQQCKAFGVGLAVALSDTDEWAANSITRDLLPLIENKDDRDRRRAVIGEPTMHGRHDLARHFFLCEAIAAISSASIAESAGLLKELQDAQGKSGFSFPDLAADLAGISLVAHVQASPARRLRQIAKDFTVKAYVPPIDDLREGMSTTVFREQYGSLSDPRFTGELEKVRARVREMPGYKNAGAASDAKPPDTKPTRSKPANSKGRDETGKPATKPAAVKEPPPKAQSPKTQPPTKAPPAKTPSAGAN